MTCAPAAGRDAIDPGPGPATLAEGTADRSYDTVSTPAPARDVRVLSVDWEGDTLQIARSLEEYERVLHDLRNRTILLVVVVALGAAALGWLIAMTVTRPLVRLTRAATDVERSRRLDVEVPVDGKDEVGRLGDAFNGMLAALAASRDDQRRLVEDAGHELRTPLTSLRTNLAVLRRHPDLDPETRERVLADLHTETEELVGLVEEVVALARGVTDGSPPERIELGPLAVGVAARAERRHGRPVTVTADELRRRGAASGAGAGDLQPHRQRRQVRSDGQPHRGRRRGRRRDRARPRSGRPPGRCAAHLRPLLPGRWCPHPAGFRPRAVDRA